VSTYVITGAGSGIGATTTARLRADGHQVIGIDLRGADIEADLSTPEGRGAAVAAVQAPSTAIAVAPLTKRGMGSVLLPSGTALMGARLPSTVTPENDPETVTGTETVSFALGLDAVTS